MKYIGVIWNPTYEYRDEIKNIVSKYGTINRSFELDLSREIFCDFIDELYNYPQDEKWKSNYKINDLTVFNNKKICILDFEINDNVIITNSKGKQVSKKAQELKDLIRDKYKTVKIDNKECSIYSENAFHLTDNDEEYLYQKKVIERYNHISFLEDLESAKYYDSLPRFSHEVYDFLGIENASVADVGCGTGRVTIDLLERNNTVYAIDMDKNMRDICDKKCQKFKNKYISIDGMDSKMNIPNHSVDYVIVVQAFHRFDPQKFKLECNRVLKKDNNVLIIWYRVDYSDPIIKKMLESVKKNFTKYATRYGDKSEIEGAIQEADANGESAIAFFDGNCVVNDVISRPLLSQDEFITLGLSLSLFPIKHSMNTVSKILDSDDFNKSGYIEDLNNIYHEYVQNNKIELNFKVQIYSHN